jgi:hypothetical protein
LEEEKLLIAEEEDRKIQVKICDDQLREKVETHKQSNKKNGRKVKSPKKKNEEVVRYSILNSILKINLKI